MRRLGLVISAAALTFTLGGCELVMGRPHGVPQLTLPPGAPPMAVAIAAAAPVANERSSVPAVSTHAYPLQLRDFCRELCPGVTGLGYGLEFRTRGPDGLPGDVLVVLDAELNVILTTTK